MEIKAKRNKTGEYMIEIGPVIFNLSQSSVESLYKVISQRAKASSEHDKLRMEKRLAAYRSLAIKLGTIEDAIMQSILNEIRPEQMVTLARISRSKEVYDKIVRNLSRQNARQFEEDYGRLSKISVHQAGTHMEQMLPVLKKAIQARKDVTSKG